ncbi:MAG TPA: hypothetical protein VGB53_04955 [Rubricoccaceae bacterium]|jgi:hypothetical protein
MRTLLLPALALAAFPALAQSAPPRTERHIVITVDSTADGERFVFRRPEGAGANVEFRRFEHDGGPEVHRFERDGVVVRRFGRDGADSDTLRFRLPSPDVLLEGVHGMMDGPFREFFGSPGVSDETRERMQELDRRSRDLAREARAASGSDRDRLERDLGGVLAELFDVRADARREQAAHLRAEADELEAGLRERDARREAILDARRRELLGESDGADW